MAGQGPSVEVPVRGIVRALVAVSSSVVLAAASLTGRWVGFEGGCPTAGALLGAWVIPGSVGSLPVGALLVHLRERRVAFGAAEADRSAEGEGEPPSPLRLLPGAGER